jgi:hypothetical protein
VTTDDGGKDAEKEPDSPGAAASAFLQAAVKWPDESGDTNVSIAFLLGWRARRAVAFEHLLGQGENETPGIDDGATQYRVLGKQIDAAVATLIAADDSAPATSLTSFADQIDTPVAVRTQIYESILALLYGKDASLGKAAFLGYRLHELSAPDVDAGQAQQDLGSVLVEIGETSDIKLLLAALSTKFPSNAAHSVINSLSLWEHERDAQRRASRGVLQAQGVIWRSFLAGETAPKDVLHLSDYVGTSDEVIKRLRNMLGKALTGSMWWLPVGVVVLVALGAGLLIATNGSSDGVVGGASSLIAAFGLTWKAIGQFFGKAAAKAEQSIWDSQVDWTIAYRATIANDPDSDVEKARTNSRSAHYDLWKKWDKVWPSTSLDDGDPRGL